MLICSIGECMIEVSNIRQNIFKLAHAGDTANTSIYLSRLGANSSYLTSVGNDYLSNKMIQFLKNEKVYTKNIYYNANKTVGLYLIQNNKKGERKFFYWRSDSAAKTLFDICLEYVALLIGPRIEWLKLERLYIWEWKGAQPKEACPSWNGSLGDMMARAGASKTMTQQEAGRLLSKKVKKHFDEFDREHRRKVAKQLRKIGIKEKGNMRKRIRRHAGRVSGKKLMSSKDANNIAGKFNMDL